MAIVSRLIEYTHQGVTLEGVLAWDDAIDEPRPGVMVAHAWMGRGEFEIEKARELAELGYVGFAIDMFGKGVLGTSAEENAALMAPFIDDRLLLQARITQALEVIRAQPEVDAARIAATGYCFGGLVVLDLARIGADVLGVVGLHGLFTPPEPNPKRSIRAKVLCLHGFDDPMAEPQAMLDLADELTAGGADWQIHAYGNTVHGFTNPAAYNPVADRRAHQATNDFLAECFDS